MNPGNPIVLHFASGASLFSGAVILLVLLALASRLRYRWRRTLRDVAVFLGAALMGLSATPGPRGLMICVAIGALAWIVCEHVPREWAMQGTKFCRGLLALLVVLTVGLELPHWFMPELPEGRHARIYVLGDSISQGIIKGVSWPAALQARHGVEVMNLARNGATAADALDEAKGLPAEANLVVIEIGGNDMLGGTPVDQFASDLDALLGHVSRRGRVVLMLELPLPPLYEEWGRVQRELARRHGVILVPKHYFAGVLGTDGATADGLHLSASGADAMGDMVYERLKRILAGSH